MAKRELIDISKDKLIEMVIKIAESYGASMSETSDLDCQLSDLPAVTEEEIVKPYLNKIAVKLGELIAENMENDNGLPVPNQYAYCYQEVFEFVSSLLTEKEQGNEV